MRRPLILLLVAVFLLMAGGQDAFARTAHRLAKPPGNGTTTTTVMGGGKPSTWPAAKPYPPSLAGAYSPNMKTAFLTLVRYSDWVGSHPNPKLVKNYVSAASDVYAAQVYLMREMAKLHLHLPPTPSQIDFLVTVKKPIVRRKSDGNPIRLAGRLAYTSGTIYVVVQQVTEPYLNKYNQVVGHSTRGTGPKPWKITLVQRDVNGQFVIDGYYALTVHGSLSAWERSLQIEY